jgi:uncharacterized YccA/Bax inhibitor family protein
MALFNSGNPTLSQKIFDRSLDNTNDGVMTVRGSINKFGFLLFMVIAGAVYSWHLFSVGKFQSMTTLLWVGLIGGLISGLVTSFKPKMAQYLAPLYGIFEGLVLGGISAIVNDQFSQKYPGIVAQAVALTLGIGVVMFLLYNFRIIKATEKFKSVLVSAIFGILLLYAAYWILSLFHVNMAFMNWNDTSLLGIGINIFIAVIASLCLIMDFDRIEQGAATGAPKYMEWYGAFGLLVTMVWLYIQILQLLSRFAGRK